MKPETHGLTGLAIGTALCLGHSFTESLAIGAVTAFGSVLPDIPIFFSVKYDDYVGRERFSAETETSGWFLAKEISHSPFLWFFPLLFAISIEPSQFQMCLLGFGLGVLSHWVIDVLTHTGPQFTKTDQSLLFPLYYLFPGHSTPGNIPKLGYWFGENFWGWEYRMNYLGEGDKKEDVTLTKRPERIVQGLVILITALLLIWWVMQWWTSMPVLATWGVQWFAIKNP